MCPTLNWPTWDILKSTSNCTLGSTLTANAAQVPAQQATVFIQIDAHALRDTRPLHHQALGPRKWMKSIMFVPKTHGFAVRFRA